MSSEINMTKRRRRKGSWEGGDLEKENSSVLDMPSYGCERNSHRDVLLKGCWDNDTNMGNTSKGDS